MIPRKQRFTAKKIFESLVDKYDFQGGYRTVCTYVSSKKKELKTKVKEAHERLEHLGGEAQVDFYTGKVSNDSLLVDQFVLVMSFPNSNGAFVHPLPSQNQECFLEGMKMLFVKLGKVPNAIWFDNLSAAVVSILKGDERILTEMFKNFVCHYGFKPIFCAPNRGNEKGNVENKCGYSRRNWLVPIPVVSDYESFCLKLDNDAYEDMQRNHYDKGIKIWDLLEQEKCKMLDLPNVELEVFKLRNVNVNKYGEVTINKEVIKVFDAQIGDQLLVKCYWNRYEFLNNDYRAIQCTARGYMLKKDELPWKEIFKRLSRKPRSVSHSQFVGMLPQALKEYISVADLELRKERVTLVLQLLSVYNINDIAETLTAIGSDTKQGEITHMLPAVVKKSRQIESTFTDVYTPMEVRTSNQTLDVYDSLLKGGELK